MPDNRNRPKRVYEETPWNFSDKTSPDGKYIIEFTNAGEIGMSGPWSATGSLVNISTGVKKLISKDCGGPAVWSTDSRYVAVPVFVSRTDQKLAIVHAESGEVRFLPESVMLLSLKSFKDTTIEAIRNKIGKEEAITFDVSSLISNNP